MFRSTPPFIPQFRPLALDPLGAFVPGRTQERGYQEGIDSEAEKECSMFNVQSSLRPITFTNTNAPPPQLLPSIPYFPPSLASVPSVSSVNSVLSEQSGERKQIITKNTKKKEHITK